MFHCIGLCGTLFFNGCEFANAAMDELNLISSNRRRQSIQRSPEHYTVACLFQLSYSNDPWLDELCWFSARYHSQLLWRQIRPLLWSSADCLGRDCYLRGWVSHHRYLNVHWHVLCRQSHYRLWNLRCPYRCTIFTPRDCASTIPSSNIRLL